MHAYVHMYMSTYMYANYVCTICMPRHDNIWSHVYVIPQLFHNLIFGNAYSTYYCPLDGVSKIRIIYSGTFITGLPNCLT